MNDLRIYQGKAAELTNGQLYAILKQRDANPAQKQGARVYVKNDKGHGSWVAAAAFVLPAKTNPGKRPRARHHFGQFQLIVNGNRRKPYKTVRAALASLGLSGRYHAAQRAINRTKQYHDAQTGHTILKELL